jgi:hypothetical protein
MRILYQVFSPTDKYDSKAFYTNVAKDLCSGRLKPNAVEWALSRALAQTVHNPGAVFVKLIRQCERNGGRVPNESAPSAPKAKPEPQNPPRAAEKPLDYHQDDGESKRRRERADAEFIRRREEEESRLKEARAAAQAIRQKLAQRHRRNETPQPSDASAVAC